VDIEWLPHARERLRERGIHESLVLQVLREPQQVLGRGVHKVFQRRSVDMARQKEYVVRVFVEGHPGVMVVRSVYRTSKIHKYWRMP